MSKREIIVAFLAVMFFIPLTCTGAFAEMNVCDYTLGGYLSLGGGFLPDPPRHRDAGYLEEYIPFPEGFLAEADLSLKSKDALEYYRFLMSHPGLSDQDFLLQAGKLGVYHTELEYDQLQHLYSTVNPFNDNIRMLVQRLRFSGNYMPTPDINIFAENLFQRRTGQQPATYSLGSPDTQGGYNFTTYLRPIGYSQDDLKAGVEFDRRIFQFRTAYHLSTFVDDSTDVLGRSGTTNSFVALPPSNIANYVTGEGALNLLAYKTRLTGSFSYGWLAENDTVINRNGVQIGDAGLTASTMNGYISGVTRPWAPLTLRYAYRAYDFENSSADNRIMNAISDNIDFFREGHYSYLRQTGTVGADYKVNNMLAFNVAYAWEGVDRSHEMGHTTSNTPQVGIRLFPTAWLNLTANYAFSDRQGSDYLQVEDGEVIKYKTFAGDDKRHKVDFIAEVFPLNNVTFSFNFSFFNDDFNNSAFGLLSDQGWSAGADVSWRPFERVALSLGYDHQAVSTHELARQASPGTVPDPGFVVGGDTGPRLHTSDAYDTVTAKGDFKLIPNKLSLTTSASYSFSTSDFHNPVMPNLHESFTDVDTWCTYRFNEHWGCKMGYIFEIFNMTDAYQTLYLTGIPATANQMFNTLGGFYRDGTAHVLEGYIQYRF
jgi:hypothetical protein